MTLRNEFCGKFSEYLGFSNISRLTLSFKAEVALSCQQKKINNERILRILRIFQCRCLQEYYLGKFFGTNPSSVSEWKFNRASFPEAFQFDVVGSIHRNEKLCETETLTFNFFASQILVKFSQTCELQKKSAKLSEENKLKKRNNKQNHSRCWFEPMLFETIQSLTTFIQNQFLHLLKLQITFRVKSLTTLFSERLLYLCSFLDETLTFSFLTYHQFLIKLS